ncbi:four helix bundle protein [Deltaproteobacteria bacterium TL4]
MNSFEDLEVWKKACRLSVDVYKMLKDTKDYGLKDQMCRAAVSIPSNIAEGSERHSKADFIRFLRIAMGSAAELRTQMYIAIEIELIPKETAKDFIERLKSISQMLQALVNSLNR